MLHTTREEEENQPGVFFCTWVNMNSPLDVCTYGLLFGARFFASSATLLAGGTY